MNFFSTNEILFLSNVKIWIKTPAKGLKSTKFLIINIMCSNIYHWNTFNLKDLDFCVCVLVIEGKNVSFLESHCSCHKTGTCVCIYKLV